MAADKAHVVALALMHGADVAAQVGVVRVGLATDAAGVPPTLTLQQSKLSQSRRVSSITWLLMPWLLASPGHQQPCYWHPHTITYDLSEKAPFISLCRFLFLQQYLSRIPFEATSYYNGACYHILRTTSIFQWHGLHKTIMQSYITPRISQASPLH